MTSSAEPLATPQAVRIRSAVPTFLVRDVAATARWYADNLGFHIAGHFPDHEPYAYASLQLGGAELMLLSLADYEKPDLTGLRPACGTRMEGVRTLYEAVLGRSFIKMPLKKQPYGDWEFEVRDPNGYILVFGGDVDV
jgi:uncharacterized glyoxalase superfamily protein PhnB